jgi:hypothetical protein
LNVSILRLFQVTSEPVKDVVVPELGVLRFKYPMAFVRKDDELVRLIP